MMKSIIKNLFSNEKAIADNANNYVEKQILYNQLFSGKISLAEYLELSR